MRHRKKKATLGRERAQRKALMRSLAESLILHDAIVTTKSKAKALRVFVEPLVTKARKNRPIDKEMIQKTLYTAKAFNRLVKEIAPRYENRPGGYTRIIKLGLRQGDKSEKVKIEFV